MTLDREQLLDEIARCFARAAVDALLADPNVLKESAVVPDQERRRRKGNNRAEHNPFPAVDAT